MVCIILADIFFVLMFPIADVLKARLKTIGVIEHSFHISSGTNRGVQWKIYDVGGARNQRHAWAPYFEGKWIESYMIYANTDVNRW